MKAEDAARLLDALQAQAGIVCVVGAGGKKTTLRRLLDAAEALGAGPVASTATVMVAPFPDHPLRPVVVAAPDELEGRLRRLLEQHHGSLAYACPSSKPLRLAGVPPALVRRLHDELGLTLSLVKADGARMRAIKAPRPDEPVLPPSPDVILPVVSAQAIDRPLDERTAHRVERLAGLTGRQPGEPLQPEDIGALLAAPAGSLQHVGAATVIPIINAVDDPDRRHKARAAAAVALQRTRRFDRIVLASMILADPLVEIVERH